METTNVYHGNFPGGTQTSGSRYAPTERILRIRKAVLAEKNSICLERAALLDRFRSTKQGRAAQKDHPFLRRAKALAYVMENRRPRLYGDELIIGNMTGKRIAANFYPEGGSINILEDILQLEKRQNPFFLPYSERLQMVGIGARNMLRSVAGKALLRPGRFSHFLDFFHATRYFITEEAGVAHQVGGYHNVVHHGLVRVEGIAQNALKSGARPDGSALTEDNRAFYQSLLVTIDGIRKMAANLAAEAQLASRQSNITPERKEELERMADACLHVPYLPARTFYEGLQSCWLVHIAMIIEDFEQGMSFGRLDRILLPLYRQDIEAGRLTPESAVELMASFGLKTCETIPLYSDRIDRFFSGNGVAQGITVGGVDENGNDTTNELSGLILDAYAQILTREPALHVRVHDQSPRWFIEDAARIIQLGTGKPSLFGDAAIIKALEGAGMTTEHARDYAVIGCVEMASQGRTYNSSDAALFNLPLCLELALNGGNRMLGLKIPGITFGAKTLPPEKLTTFDHVLHAFAMQVDHAIDEMVRVITWIEDAYKIHRTTPVNSMVTEGCLDTGLDVTWGGALYDLTSIQVAGLADTGDSLYALKRLVFNEKRYTLPEFVDILQHNFLGHETLQKELSIKFPRYGNNDPDADAMTQTAADVYSDSIRRYKNSRGGQYVPGVYSMTCHVGFGNITGALPNGRLAGERLSNGLSPSDGSDRHGPTAMLNSAAGLDSSKWANCCALNLKFDAQSVQDERGRKILADLFTAYFKQGGMQLQVNVLDADILREAKENPSMHRGLVVRVAGYCAYFHDLQPAVQDEIIERTAHRL